MPSLVHRHHHTVLDRKKKIYSGHETIIYPHIPRPSEIIWKAFTIIIHSKRKCSLTFYSFHKNRVGKETLKLLLHLANSAWGPSRVLSDKCGIYDVCVYRSWFHTYLGMTRGHHYLWPYESIHFSRCIRQVVLFTEVSHFLAVRLLIYINICSRVNGLPLINPGMPLLNCHFPQRSLTLQN